MSLHRLEWSVSQSRGMHKRLTVGEVGLCFPDDALSYPKRLRFVKQSVKQSRQQKPGQLYDSL